VTIIVCLDKKFHKIFPDFSDIRDSCTCNALGCFAHD